MTDTPLTMSVLVMLDYLSSYKHGVLYAAATGTGQQAALLTDLNRGYQRFIRGGYYDDFNRIKVHRWSFLEVADTISLADGDADYLLTDAGALTQTTGGHAVWTHDYQFGGFVEPPIYAYDADNKAQNLERKTPEQIRYMWAQDNTESQSLFYAVEPLPFVEATGQTFQMIVAPVPDATYVLNVRYSIIPNQFPSASASVYPVGGAMFSDVIIQSSLAVIERDTTGVGAMEQQFQTLMKEAVAIDSATTGKATVENRYDRFPRHRMI